LAFGAVRAELAEVSSPRVPDLLAAGPADAATRLRTRQILLSALVLEGAEVENVAAPLVVTISRIAPQKNLPVLVQAAVRLRQPCSWVVVGDGDPQLLAELRQQADELAAPVHFVGSRSKVGEWLRAAEVFVLPSQWEARALVVQEAMAAGTPVVATDVGGLHDLVETAGLLVPPGDAEAIAKAVNRILADPDLREELAARGEKVAEALPDGSDTVSQWLAWYSETLRIT
jgi:glycosyltransferase involved in cell wall biosynthesis